MSSTHSRVPDLIASMQADEEEQLEGEELLRAFKHMLGDLYIDASSISYISELGVGELAIVERGLYYPPTGGRVRLFARVAPQCVCARGQPAPRPACCAAALPSLVKSSSMSSLTIRSSRPPLPPSTRPKPLRVTRAPVAIPPPPPPSPHHKHIRRSTWWSRATPRTWWPPLRTCGSCWRRRATSSGCSTGAVWRGLKRGGGWPTGGTAPALGAGGWGCRLLDGPLLRPLLSLGPAVERSAQRSAAGWKNRLLYK